MKTKIYLRELVQGLNEVVYSTHSAQGLAHTSDSFKIEMSASPYILTHI